MADKTLYTKNSIESLDPREFTRLKPGVYAGDTTYATQLLIEIFSNALDEHRLNHGNLINVKIDGDKITLRDHGQGFLVNEKRDDGKTVLEAAFSVLNTSGKFREDGSYEGTSLGAFGIGSKLTNFLSKELVVTTYRDGKFEKIKFNDGLFKDREVGVTKETNGTKVVWVPDGQFFVHPQVEVNKIKALFKTIACLCPGLTIELNDNGELTLYHSKNGINDLIDEVVNRKNGEKIGEKEIISPRLNINWKEDKYGLDLTMTYTNFYSSSIVAYVNTGSTESGPHITQIKTALTREMNKFFRDKGWLKEKDNNIEGSDLQEGLYMIFNMTAPSVGYDAQIKARVVQIECAPMLNIFKEELVSWLSLNEKEVKKIFDKAVLARKAREAAKKARDTAREVNTSKKNKVVKFASKLADANSADRVRCEIFVVEGDSAAGNLKAARDNKFQAIMPVRGKILNTQKATLAQIQKNAEIMTMIEAFGLKADTRTMKLTFDERSLRYGKIIIASDADIDGSHIKNLFYTFVWNFCPELVERGYIYALVPPLYKIILPKNKGYKYLKNDAELKEYRQTHSEGYQVQRFKGLGELSVDETEETLLDPNNRILTQVTVEDIKKTNLLFETLMGTAVLGRKKFIEENSEKAGNYNV